MFSRKPDIQIHGLSPMLGEAIKQCRRSLDMPVQELAIKIRKTPDFVLDLEHAKTNINSQILEDCAAAFGLSASELVEIALSEKVLVVARTARPKHQPRKVASGF
jgi:ribosome-binding protein aMBF1 (putative translation factor)